MSTIFEDVRIAVKNGKNVLLHGPQANVVLRSLALDGNAIYMDTDQWRGLTTPVQIARLDGCTIQHKDLGPVLCVSFGAVSALPYDALRYLITIMRNPEDKRVVVASTTNQSRVRNWMMGALYREFEVEMTCREPVTPAGPEGIGIHIEIGFATTEKYANLIVDLLRQMHPIKTFEKQKIACDKAPPWRIVWITPEYKDGEEACRLRETIKGMQMVLGHTNVIIWDQRCREVMRGLVSHAYANLQAVNESLIPHHEAGYVGLDVTDVDLDYLSKELT